MSRLALVTLDYPPERGGVARYLGNLVQASQGAIDVFVNETHQASGPGTVRPVQLLTTGRWSWRPLVQQMKRFATSDYQFVLVSHVLPVGTAAWLARLRGGKPYVVCVHGLDLQLASVQRRKRWLARQILEGAHTVVANSQFTAGLVRAIAPHAKTLVLTPGIERQTYPEKGAARRSLQIADHVFQLVVVSRLVARKGIDRTIEALRSLPEHIHLAIVGDGEDRRRLERLVDESGVGSRVRWVPVATDGERNQWYAASDAFVMPVREEGRDVEGFGIVYLEAAAAGLPVIAGRAGGASEAVVHEVTGLLVDGTKPEQIVSAVLTLLEAPERARQMGDAGRARVQEGFSWTSRWEVLRDRLSLV